MLGDRTGSVAAELRDGVADVGAVWHAGAPVHVTGRYRIHPRDGARIAVRSLRAARPEDVDWTALLDGPPRAAAQMEADLRELVATVQNPHLRALLDAVLRPGAGWRRFRDAPAAKRYHQAYRHGLLEHSLSVAQAVSADLRNLPGDRPRRRRDGRAAARHRQARGLHGRPYGDRHDRRSASCRARSRSATTACGGSIEDLPGFPADLAGAVLHIILSPPRTLEHGSPVVPCTREATLVHMIDNLGGRLGSFDRLEKELPDGSRWSGYDRALGGGAYFAERAAEPGRPRRPARSSSSPASFAASISSRISSAAATMRCA